MDVSETLRLRATEIVEMKKAALIKSDLEPMLASKGKDIMSILCTYDVQSMTFTRNSSLPLLRTVKSNMTLTALEKISDEELVAQVSYVLVCKLLQDIIRTMLQDHHAGWLQHDFNRTLSYIIRSRTKPSRPGPSARRITGRDTR